MKRELLRSIRQVRLLVAITLTITGFRALPAQAQTIGYGWTEYGYFFPEGPIQPPGIEGGLWPSEASALAGLTAWSGFTVTSCNPTYQYSYWAPAQAWGANIENQREYLEYYEVYPACTPTPYGSLGTQWLSRVSYISPYTPSLVDPAPAGEVNANGVIADANALSASSNTVVGIAADGAAEIVVRISAPSAGTAIQLSVADENDNPAAAGSGNALGYLTTLLPSDGSSSTAGGQPITVTTVPVASGGAMAFAVYHAPKDFVRDGNSTDPTLSNRPEFVEVSAGGTVQTEQEIEIVRPPVAFIHGIWGTGLDGDDILSSLIADNVGLTTYSLDYAGPVTIVFSTPSYGSNLTVSGNNLGFEYAANLVLSGLYHAIADYRANNTLGQQIAVSGADIVAHSMGGDVARYLPLIGGYAATANYELGPIHKLITIGTPHLGSPLATQLVNSSNACVQQILAHGGRYAFSSAQTPYGVSYDGGVGDLEGDVNGTPSSLSPALTSIQPSTSSTSMTIPTGLIAAAMTSAQLNAVNGSVLAGIIRGICGPDPLAVDLTASNWPSLVSGQSDAIVPTNSQLAGLSTNTEFPLAGDIHSPGTEDLGFAGPSELDDTAFIPGEVLQLLNTPVDNQSVFISLP